MLSNLNLGPRFKYTWKFLVIVLVPLIFLPLLLQGSKELKCAYVICIMGCYWVTEAVPLPITSLLPVVLFPLLGVESTSNICVMYLKETNMMFLGGMMVAIAVEHCGLHKRIALKTLLMIGTGTKSLLLGFMLTSMFLSMWISNAASTAMMMPIAIAVMKIISTDGRTAAKSTDSNQGTSLQLDESSNQRPTKQEMSYFLGINYAANIGGTGTLTGCCSNIVFKGIYQSLFPKAEPVTYATWMLFNSPVMLLNCAIAWVWLLMLFMGPCNSRKKLRTREQETAVRAVIQKQYNDLGSMSYHEVNVLVLFVALVCLWFFRQPEFMTGWSEIYDGIKIEDATAAMLIVFLLFVLPANLDFLNFASGAQSPALLNWKIVHEKIPWGLILLMGAGFALAAVTQSSGLSSLLGDQLISLGQLPPVVILILVCVIITFMTEITSNTAVANITLPVLAKLCVSIDLNPLYLMLPATVCSSYSFMLPVASPPNAIVTAASNMRTVDMMKVGFALNLLCPLCLIACFLLFGSQIYDLSTSPLDQHLTNSSF